jgi:hypothetical protein
MNEPTQAVGAPLERQVRPRAWLCELAQEDGTTRTQFVEQDPNGLRWNDAGEPSPYRTTPLIAYPSGWRFKRDHNNRIVVTMPDGGGCVVDNVANDQRMIPEEVLFALCKALGA